MALTTSRLALPYPEDPDPADVPLDMKALAERMDAVGAAYDQGTVASRPEAGLRGRIYLSTDTGEVSVDSGTAWSTLVPATGGQLAAIADLKFSARKAEHAGWIIANGRVLTPSQYPQLRAQLLADGSAYGVSGSDPKLPDLRDRVPVGSGNHAVGEQGGAETVALAASQMPSHSHSIPRAGVRSHVTGAVSNGSLADEWPGGNGWALNGIGVIFTANPNRYAADVGATNAMTSGGAGSSAAHSNMQPYAVGTWFIYAGPAT